MSKKNKKAFIATVVKGLSELDPGNPCIKVIEQQLNSLTNEQFENYITALRNGVSETPDYDKPREIIPIVLPHFQKTNITITRNLSLLEKKGHKVFERVWMVDPISKQRYLTNLPYALLELPIVRQAQTLEKKIATADSTTVLDDRTHQASDSVKGASLSGPELQSLLSQGRVKTAIEFMKYRGGDDRAFRKMTKDLTEGGDFLQESYKEPTRARSVDTAAIYLKAMHFQTDL